MERYQIVSEEELHHLLRGDVLPAELLGEDWDAEDAPKVRAEAVCRIHVEDVLSVLRKASSMGERKAEEFLDDWLFLATDTDWFAKSVGLVELTEKAPERAGHFPELEEDWLLYLLDELEDAFEEEDAEALPLIEELIEAGECWLRNQGRDIREWEIPGEMIDRFICDVDEMMESEDAFSQEAEMFQYYVEKLVTEGDVHARHIKAYQCLRGTAAFSQDTEAAEKLLTGLFEETREPAYAYTLGMLLRGAETPEHELAFRYFLFAAGAGDVRAKCRLSAMYLKGQGTWMNRSAAEHIASTVYEEERREFCRGGYEGYFAEAALAESEYFAVLADYEDDDEMKLNYVIESYGFAMQSLFGLKKRRILLEGEEDEEIKSRAKYILTWQKELLEPQKASGIRTEYLQDIIHAVHPEPMFMLRVQRDANDCSLELRLPQQYGEEKPPKLLVTVPEAEFCTFKDKVIIDCLDVRMTGDIPQEEVLVTSYDIDVSGESCCVHFYQFEKEICCLEAKEFGLTFGDI